jgi:uncharacterized protein YdaU (DUF1376 family)
MSVVEFGAYTSLLMEIWLDPSGSLPDDPDELAVYSRLGDAWPQYERKLMGLFYVQDGRVRSEIVDEARDRIVKRSEQAKEAVAERERKKAESGKVEPGKPSNDERPKIDRSSKEKEKEKVNEKEKAKAKEESSLSPEGDGGGGKKARLSYSPGFEAFWKAWRGLGGKTTLNKVAAFEAYKKCLRRGAEDSDLLAAVGVYDKYLTYRTKSGKTDARDFIPMPETWLNQDRWQSEYPDEVLDQMVGTPVSGRDFYWNSHKDAKGYEYVGRFVLGPNGEKTDEVFNEKAWREARRGDLA